MLVELVLPDSEEIGNCYVELEHVPRIGESVALQLTQDSALKKFVVADVESYVHLETPARNQVLVSLARPA